MKQTVFYKSKFYKLHLCHLLYGENVCYNYQLDIINNKLLYNRVLVQNIDSHNKFIYLSLTHTFQGIF